MTEQIKHWDGEFGKEYTKRNARTLSEMDDKYRENWGTTREAMNREFLSEIKFDSILEVGTNVGNQLMTLQKSGYENLWGIEVSKFAFEKSKQNIIGANIVRADAFDIPFKDRYFDLVFTSGVLIHISPDDINRALDEIYRVSRKYIWGFEYYADEYEAVSYRGNEGLLWKTDFAGLYLKRFPGLKLVKQKKYPYKTNDNVDVMFLLERS